VKTYKLKKTFSQKPCFMVHVTTAQLCSLTLCRKINKFRNRKKLTVINSHYSGAKAQR